VQLHSWVKVLLNSAVFVDHPSAKVPRKLQHLVRISLAYKLLGVRTEVLENFVSIGPVNVTFVHEWEGYAVLLVDCFLNLLVRVGLLIIELVAWEGNNLKSPFGVHFVHLNQCEIVLLCEGSVRGDIHYDCCPFLLHEFTNSSFNQIDICDLHR
jgi:hypothetical protein